MLQDRRRDVARRVIEEKIRTFSRVEKAFYGSIVMTGLLLAISVVFVQTRLLVIQSEMAQINQDITDKQLEINDAKQAVNELLRQSRLMEVAEKAGLTFNNENSGVIE